MTPWIRTLLVRAPLAFLIVAVFLAAFSTPAPARPTTPCDENPGCATPGSSPRGRDSGGHADDTVTSDERIDHRPQQPDDEDGGQDSGGWNR